MWVSPLCFSALRILSVFQLISVVVQCNGAVKESTLDREIFAVKIFSSVPYDDEKDEFSTSNNCTSALAKATKIKQRENLTDENFYERKFPDLR